MKETPTKKSNPVPVGARDLTVARKYLLGRMTRAEVNRYYKLLANSPSGLHRVARASRQLVLGNPMVEKVINSLTLDESNR